MQNNLPSSLCPHPGHRCEIESRYVYLISISVVMSNIRPHLEYGNVIWHPYLRKDIEMTERVQHRATRMVPGLSKLSYEDRLRKMDLPTLEYRRSRGDAIEVYKYARCIQGG